MDSIQGGRRLQLPPTDTVLQDRPPSPAPPPIPPISVSAPSHPAESDSSSPNDVSTDDTQQPSPPPTPPSRRDRLLQLQSQLSDVEAQLSDFSSRKEHLIRVMKEVKQEGQLPRRRPTKPANQHLALPQNAMLTPSGSRRTSLAKPIPPSTRQLRSAGIPVEDVELPNPTRKRKGAPDLEIEDKRQGKKVKQRMEELPEEGNSPASSTTPDDDAVAGSSKAAR